MFDEHRDFDWKSEWRKEREDARLFRGVAIFAGIFTFLAIVAFLADVLYVTPNM